MANALAVLVVSISIYALIGVEQAHGALSPTLVAAGEVAWSPDDSPQLLMPHTDELVPGQVFRGFWRRLPCGL